MNVICSQACNHSTTASPLNSLDMKGLICILPYCYTHTHISDGYKTLEVLVVLVLTISQFWSSGLTLWLQSIRAGFTLMNIHYLDLRKLGLFYDESLCRITVSWSLGKAHKQKVYGWL